MSKVIFVRSIVKIEDNNFLEILCFQYALFFSRASENCRGAKRVCVGRGRSDGKAGFGFEVKFYTHTWGVITAIGML